jgi:hypothetical protein
MLPQLGRPCPLLHLLVAQSPPPGAVGVLNGQYVAVLQRMCEVVEPSRAQQLCILHQVLCAPALPLVGIVRRCASAPPALCQSRPTQPPPYPCSPWRASDDALAN